MPSEGVKQKSSWWVFWPVLVAGLLGPPLGNLLARSMPAYWAEGVDQGTVWFFVGVILMRRYPPRFGLPRWLAPILIAIAVGFCGAVLAYYIPLK